MPNTERILFLDLETTGSDVEYDEIIEVGLILLDAKTLEEVGSFRSTVFPQDRAWDRIMRNDKVLAMHSGNGLLEDITRIHVPGAPVVDRRIINWLDENGIGKDHVPYGGSGVGHFDKKFIDKYLPLFSKRITYWPYDVGSIRRTYELAGGTNWPAQDKNHRALDDARFHVEEFKFAMDIFKAIEHVREDVRAETKQVVADYRAALTKLETE